MNRYPAPVPHEARHGTPLVVRMVAALVMGAVVVGALLLPSPIVAQQGDIALVYRILLDRELLLTPARGDVRPAELGDRLSHGDALRTGPNTRAAIRFTDDGSLVRLNPGSALHVRAEGDRSALSKTLELEFGELWARVTRREDAAFQVRTPAGVAAVKGTEFVVRVAGDGSTTVITLSGVVDFFNGVGTVEVRAGMRATAESADHAPQLSPLDEDEVEALGELVDAGDGGATGEMVEVVLRLRDDQGRVRTLTMTLPRGAAARYLEGIR